MTHLFASNEILDSIDFFFCNGGIAFRPCSTTQPQTLWRQGTLQNGARFAALEEQCNSLEEFRFLRVVCEFLQELQSYWFDVYQQLS